MSKVHTGVLRVRTPDGSDPPADLLQFAKKAMGALLENVHRQNLPSSTRTHRFPDGSVVTASWDGTTPTVTITPPHPVSTETTVDFSPLWVPRGFIIYPAYSDAPFGVGLPIVADTDKDPYGAYNLAPGIDHTRWTPGGPCGEVLLTTDKNAGYPAAATLVCPLLYDKTAGPNFLWYGKGSYDSRPATSPWTAYRIEFAAPQQHFPNESPGATLALYAQVNLYRVANGMKAMYLPPRGYYDAGAGAASIMFTNGAATETSPAYPAAYRTSAQRFTKDGYSAFLLGGPFSTWARGDNPTAYELRSIAGGTSAVMGAWQSDTTANDGLLLDYGPGGFLDVGYRGGYWAAELSTRTSWIAAGNCYWRSSDQDIPPVSWYGFASVNLAWETYPALYSFTYGAPLTPLLAFTDGGGNCWLNYPRATAPYPADVEPAMSRSIFMRGRNIAIAPRGGLVWGACIQTFNGIDRLIALVHHPEDQPGAYTTNGWTRYLRVWWCDIPPREHLRADPQETICGEDSTDTWCWKGGQLLDVGAMPPPAGGHIPTGACSALKYASQWKFAPDGSKAVCLRDFGIYTDYDTLHAFYGANVVNGQFPRAVELHFNLASDSVYTALTFYDFVAGRSSATRATDKLPLSGDTPTSSCYETGVEPYAVDYDTNGNLIYAFVGTIHTYDPYLSREYDYAGTGTSATQYPSDMNNLVYLGSQKKTAGSNFRYQNLIVADVRTGAFVVEGMRPRMTPIGVADATCFPFTSALVHGVRVWRRGTLLDETWYPAPDGTIFAPGAGCIPTGGGSDYVWLPLASSCTVQAYLAESTQGSIFSYQVGPVPVAARVLDAVPSDPQCGCNQTYDNMTAHSHLAAYSELNPRGGRVIATVPLPPYNWLIYAKVV